MARKRRKRREMASRAADEELAEITIEQQVLREMSSSKSQVQQAQAKSSQSGAGVSTSKAEKQQQPQQQQAATPKPSGKKSQQPISLSIADMISALEVRQPGAQTSSILCSLVCSVNMMTVKLCQKQTSMQVLSRGG